jgi:hypothetical protein
LVQQRSPVEGNAKIRGDVNAPKGTNVGAEASGLFSAVETYRQTHMVPADRGPSVWGDRLTKSPPRNQPGGPSQKRHFRNELPLKLHLLPTAW